MKSFLLIAALLISSQAGASAFDVIYRFDRTDNDDFFTLKIDFDYVDKGPVFFFAEEVFNYTEFVHYLQTGNDSPIFLFEVLLVDTNLSIQPFDSIVGYTTAVDGNQSLQTTIWLSGSDALVTPSQALSPLYFPTAWEAGQSIDLFSFAYPNTPQFVLTEVTQIPLPAALPLFSLALFIFSIQRPTQRVFT